MIVANLLVADIARSVAFYRDVVGLEVMMLLGPDQTMINGPEIPGDAVFATLQHGGSQLMLQTEEHIRTVLPNAPKGSSWIYIRDLDPDPVLERIGGAPLKGPEVTWYGMKEIHIADPDGHIVCIGTPEGAGPR